MFVSRSYISAEMREKESGRKLELVSTRRAAYAGKVKFAGARENWAGILVLNEPLAVVRGVLSLNEEAGDTRDCEREHDADTAVSN